MWALVVFAFLWNGAAVALGLVGAVRPQLRSHCAKWAGRQMLFAGGALVLFPVLGVACNALTAGAATEAAHGIGLFLGASIWLACGLVPMTAMAFLSARKRARASAAPQDGKSE